MLTRPLTHQIAERARVVRPRIGEQGLTMTELLIVMVIMAILTAIAIPTFMSSRDAAARKEAAGVANTYRNAIVSYRNQNFGRAPAAPGSAQWPTANLGPYNRIGALATPPKPHFLPLGPPDAVKHGLVTIGAGPPAAVQAPAKFGIFYERDMSRLSAYRLIVVGRDGQVVCDASSAPAAGAKTC